VPHLVTLGRNLYPKALAHLPFSVEHMFFSISYYHNAYQKITLCGHPANNLLEYFIMTEYGYLFQQLPYNNFTAVVIYVVNIMFTFCWNFMDIFTILVSVGIATRFHQINQRIADSVQEVNWILTLRVLWDSFVSLLAFERAVLARNSHRLHFHL
jgi:Trehalose receptor